MPALWRRDCLPRDERDERAALPPRIVDGAATAAIRQAFQLDVRRLAVHQLEYLVEHPGKGILGIRADAVADARNESFGIVVGERDESVRIQSDERRRDAVEHLERIATAILHDAQLHVL